MFDAEGALLCFDRVLRVDSRSERAWLGRGRILAQKQRNGEALACFDRALDAKHDHAPALNAKADLLLKMGMREEALAAYEAAIASSPNVAHLWLSRARVLDDLDRTHDAVGSYDEALALTDAPDIWARRAEALVKLGDLARAAESFEHALQGDPDAMDIWYRLARTQMKLDRDPRRALERFVALAPESDPRVAPARTMLGAARRMSRMPAAMPSMAPRPLSILPAEPPEVQAARQLHREGSHLEALRKIEPFVKASPSVPLWLLRAEILAHIEASQAAQDSVDKAAALEPDNADVWKTATRILLIGPERDREKRLEKATETSERLVMLVPDDPASHRLKAQVLVATGHHEEAANSLQKSLMKDRDQADVWLALAKTHDRLGRANEAREAATQALLLAGLMTHPSNIAAEIGDEARELLARLS